ncbi:zinc finger protein 699-like isoform X2 [Galleria mellonella]|uniref:Zinc finger protein 699-like isoform X2 n=1 Tax=Galleria mellonella TaxID=7137 RepID=A0A6J3BUJ6_GALME|nr:zinc finger protein 699-like isoform X2 [Galleria mellonella]
MLELKACAVCFSTNLKLFNMDSGHLRHNYNIVSGLQTYNGDSLPSYLCSECCGYVTHFTKFREKCQRANFALQEMLARNVEINEIVLDDFNCEVIGIEPKLWFIDPCTTHYEEVKYKSDDHKEITTLPTGYIPVLHYNILPNEDSFSIKNKISTNLEKTEITNVQLEKTEDTDTIVIDDDNGSENSDLNVEQNGVEELTTEQNDNSQEQNDLFDSDIVVNDDDKVQDSDNVSQKSEANEVYVKPCMVEEYANVYIITMQEAKAAYEIHKMFSSGDYRCEICNKAYSNKRLFQIHLRMHDKHKRGSFLCELCIYYYRTESQLKTHMIEKHIYKYVCRKCPEVNFKRTSAKQHYVLSHILCHKKHPDWDRVKPKWLRRRGSKRVKSVQKITKLPDDYPIISAVSQEEQYKIVEDRKETTNYIYSSFSCKLCYRGFRVSSTYTKHMKKHDPVYAGQFQCDMCKLCFVSTQKLSLHMYFTHLFKLSCKICSFVCYNKNRGKAHYYWHKNVTYNCSHCNRSFRTQTARSTHIRMYHPSTIVCDLCGHSFVSESGLMNHKYIAHRNEVVQNRRDEGTLAVWTWSNAKVDGEDERNVDKDNVGQPEAQKAEEPPDRLAMATTEDTEKAAENPHYCPDCDVRFANANAYITHLGSSSKHTVTNKSGRLSTQKPRLRKTDVHNAGYITAIECAVCNQTLANTTLAQQHYKTEHPGVHFPKRYMCEKCGYITSLYSNLVLHIRTHTNERPFKCPHCDRGFTSSCNRDRHVLSHTGEKPFQCHHCLRRFRQKNECKMHIQHAHLKVPYPSRAKKKRTQRKEIEGGPKEVEGITPVAVNAANAVTPVCVQLPPQISLDHRGDYLNAYINYTDL